jgi:hypothetical protein
MNLYEINVELRKIGEIIEENDGELTEELDERFTKLSIAYEEKLDNILALRQEYIQRAKSLNSESQRLKSAGDTAIKTADRLRQYVYDAMIANKDMKLELARFKVWRQGTAPSVKECPEAEKLPDEFVRIIPENRVIDKKALISAWKAEDQLPEGVLISTGETLRVK